MLEQEVQYIMILISSNNWSSNWYYIEAIFGICWKSSVRDNETIVYLKWILH